MECEKCGKPVWATIPTRLAGGVSAWLCTRCITEWDKFCSARPSYQRLCELGCVQASIVYARELSADRSDPALHQVLGMIRECEVTLHEEGLKWLGREV